MADIFDTVTLQISLKSEEHSITDLSFLAEAVNGIVCASIWATIAEEPESRSEAVLQARRIVSRAIKDKKAPARFFPQFGDAFRYGEPGRRGAIRTAADIEEFNPYDPFDIGVTVGLNTWLRKVIQNDNVELYDSLFSFADVKRIEHRSPLTLELAVAIGAIALSPIILTYGIMRAVARCRRLELEEKLRETEVELKGEELKQRRIQTEILEEIRTAVREKATRNNLGVPDGVLVAAATISSPSVAELSTSPLIGSVSLGVTTKIDRP